jgi:protein-S-isoprenylcysteine O-methyltransferase Ste14
VLLWALFLAGVMIVLLSTFIINHFDLFGLRQVYLEFRNKPYTDLPFKVTFFYRFVRHPLSTGFLLASWATPRMSAGHFLLAAGFSIYILIAIQYEERDLVAGLGQRYADYKARVPKLIPRVGLAHETVKPDRRQPAG